MSNTVTRTAKPRTDEDRYGVRWYESGDADGIRALFERELDRVQSSTSFEWKYHEDPYLLHVPINVAECGGEIVGVQAYLPCQLRIGERTILALQPADAVVDSEHRRNGLYTRLTRQAIDRYTAGEPALFFNYPSPGALGAQQQLGWSLVANLPVQYRVQRPSTFLSTPDGGMGRSLGASLADAVAGGVLGVLDGLAPVSDDVSVTRHDSVPAATLASLYRACVPDGLHVHREARFYEWWLGRPSLDQTTYVAESNGQPVAALVTRQPTDDVLQIREALPLAPCQPAPVMGRLLSTAIASNPSVAVVKSVGATLPETLLRRFGFVRDSTPILDGRTTPLHLAVRPLARDDSDESVADLVTDHSNWHSTFLEVDRD